MFKSWDDCCNFYISNTVINESVCPGAGHLSSFFCPGAGHCHAFPARPPGIVNLKKKKVQMPGGCPGGDGQC